MRRRTGTVHPVVGKVAAALITAGAMLGAVSGCSDDDRNATAPVIGIWADGAPSVCDAAAPIASDPILEAPGALDLRSLPQADRDHLAQSLSKAAADAATLAQELRRLDQRPPGADDALAALDRDAKAIDAVARNADVGGVADAVFAAARLRETANSMASVLDLPACRDRVGLTSRPTTPPTAPLVVSLTCVNDPPAAARIRPGPPSVDGEAAAQVECTEPHQFEQFLRFESPGGPATPFPGDVLLADHAARQCAETFAAYAARSPAAWKLSYVGFPPDAEAWNNGRRGTSCLAFDPEREAVAGPMVKPGT